MTQPAARLRLSLESARNCGSAAHLGAITFTATTRVVPKMRRQVDISHSARAELFVDPIFGVENFAGHGMGPMVQPPS